MAGGRPFPFDDKYTNLKTELDDEKRSGKGLQLICEETLPRDKATGLEVKGHEGIEKCLSGYGSSGSAVTVNCYGVNGDKWKLPLSKEQNEYVFRGDFKKMIDKIKQHHKITDQESKIQIWGCPKASWGDGVCLVFSFDL